MQLLRFERKRLQVYLYRFSLPRCTSTTVNLTVCFFRQRQLGNYHPRDMDLPLIDISICLL